MISNAAKRLVASACSLALCAALVPAVPATAYGYDGDEQIIVDNIIYVVNGSKDVRVTGVVNTSDVPAVVTIPSTVTDESSGRSYCVSNIQQNAFSGCTNMEELIIEDMTSSNGTAGQIYPTAFGGCTNLKTIHLMGNCTFTSGMHLSYDFDSCLDGLNLIFHKGEGILTPGTVVSISSNHYSGIIYPDMTTYFAVDFVQGDETVTAYVKGAQGTWNSSRNQYTETAGITYADLKDLSADDIYVEDDLCPNTVPELEEGMDAWAFMLYDSDLDEDVVQVATDSVNSCGTAVAAKASDLNYATMTLSSATLSYTGRTQLPEETVIAADGTTVESSAYDLSFYSVQSVDGETVKELITEPVEVGMYSVVATDSEGGSCEASFSIEKQQVTWSRVTGEDRYEKAQAVSASAYTFVRDFDVVNGVTSNERYYGYQDTYVPTVSASKKFRVLVNPDDRAACLVGSMLAGVLDCVVLSTGAKTLASTAAVQLASASSATVLVVGSSTSISDSVKTAAGDYANGPVRIDGSSAAELSANARAFVDKALSGEYSGIEIEEAWGTTAFVVSEEAGASAFTIAAWAGAINAPLFFCDENGALGDDDLQALTSFEAVYAPSMSSTQLEALQTALGEVPVTSIEGGSDEYASATAFALEAADAEALSFTVTALVPADDYGVLAAAAAVCGLSGAELLLGSSSSGASCGFDLLEEQLSAVLAYGIVCMDYKDMPAAIYEEYVRAWTTEEAANLYFATVSISDITATGSSLYPEIVVTASDGTVLTRNTDYTVSYVNNSTGATVRYGYLIDAGSYTVVCTGTRAAYNSIGSASGTTPEYVGTYYNTRSATFTVNAAPKVTVKKPTKPTKVKVKAGKKKATVTWKKRTSGATAYQVRYSLKKSMKKSKTVKVTGVKKAKKVIKKLKRKKVYYFQVRAINSKSGVTKYSAWSKKVHVKVK